MPSFDFSDQSAQELSRTLSEVHHAVRSACLSKVSAHVCGVEFEASADEDSDVLCVSVSIQGGSKVSMNRLADGVARPQEFDDARAVFGDLDDDAIAKVAGELCEIGTIFHKAGGTCEFVDEA